MLNSSFIFWSTTLSAVALCSAISSNEPSAENKWAPAPKAQARRAWVSHNRVSARYTTPQGIGYNHGYTTLEGFFAPINLCRDAWLPFLDLRGHVFDDGKMAANAGLGVRYLANSRVWGVNSYYDYRNTHHQHYNQVAAGLETLGKIWDFRINGYLPVGWKQSRLYHTEFDLFEGNHMILRSSRNFAMKGANAEAGFHLDRFKPAPLYFAGGPYYLTGKGASTWGGELRASVELFNRYVRLEGRTAYDHFFKWTGQGIVSVNIPFGPKAQVKQNACTSWCDAVSLARRMVQPVERMEIIPVGKQRVHSRAIDPATGDPYYFLFVDNTSRSLGTYESPYPTLVDAQNASFPNTVIYVFPGDGTSAGMDAGITLQDGQMLLGAGSIYSLPTTLGSVSIPAFASTMPVLTNTTPNPVITIANNNTVAGLYIENTNGNGIYGTGITNFTATQNTIIGGNAASGSGEAILLNNISGKLKISNTLFSQNAPVSANGYIVHIVQTDTQCCNVCFINNTLAAFVSSNIVMAEENTALQTLSGIYFDLSGTGGIGNLTINNCTLLDSTSSGGTGIQVSLADSSFVTNTTFNNVNIHDWSNGIELDLGSTESMTNLLVLNTNIINFSENAGLFVNLTGAGSIENLLVQNSTITNYRSNLYGFELSIGGSGGIENVRIQNSNLDDNAYDAYIFLYGSGSIANLSVANSSLNYAEFEALYIYVGGIGSITNVSVTDSSLRYAGGDASGVFVEVQGPGAIANINIANSIFDDNPEHSVYLYAGIPNSIQNVTVSNSSFAGSTYGLISEGPGTIGTLNINNCSFAGNMYGIFLDGEVDVLNLSDSIFTGNQYAAFINGLQGGVIGDNQFNGNTTLSLFFQFNSSASSSLSILDNTFTGLSLPTEGYAAYVQVADPSSTLCLEFVDNVATPAQDQGNAPYYFDQTAGIFNITSNSTQANNIGVIDTNGTIGNCSQ